MGSAGRERTGGSASKGVAPPAGPAGRPVGRSVAAADDAPAGVAEVGAALPLREAGGAGYPGGGAGPQLAFVAGLSATQRAGRAALLAAEQVPGLLGHQLVPQVPERTAAPGELGPPAPPRLPQRQERVLRSVWGAPRRQPAGRAQALGLRAGARRHRCQDLPARHRQGTLRLAPGPARHRVRQHQRRRPTSNSRRRGRLVGPGALPLAASPRPPGPSLRRDQGLGQFSPPQPEGVGAHAAAHYACLQSGASRASGKGPPVPALPPWP